MQPRDEEITDLWQRYARQSGALVANAALHEYFQTPEERAMDEAIRSAVSEPEYASCVDTTTSLPSSSRFLEAF